MTWKRFANYWPLVRESRGQGWIPLTKGNDAELWCFFDVSLIELLNQESCGLSFETPSRLCDIIVVQISYPIQCLHGFILVSFGWIMGAWLICVIRLPKSCPVDSILHWKPTVIMAWLQASSQVVMTTRGTDCDDIVVITTTLGLQGRIVSAPVGAAPTTSSFSA